jgi:hypothetical protein
MPSVTAVRSVVVLSVLLGLSSAARAGENFVLLVNPVTGAVAMRSDFSSTVWIDQYSITSAAGVLRPGFWNSLHDQLIAGWVETAHTTTVLSESNASGETSFQTGTGFSLGSVFDSLSFTQDLVFQYRLAGSETPSLGVVTYGIFTPPPNPVHEPMPCFGDTNDSGAVDVDDLITVILNWGACPKPPAGCVADVDDSGAVDVDDLIAVILAWGACD